MENKEKQNLFEFVHSKELNHFYYAIFDLDQTLYDYEECNKHGITSIVSAVNKKFGIDKEIILDTYLKSRETINTNLKNTSSMHSRFLYLKKMSEILSIKNPINNTIEFYNLYCEKLFEKMELFDWVESVFKKLKDQNIKIIIATDFNARIQFLKIRRLEIENYVHKIITSQEIGEEKPGTKFAETLLNSIKSDYNTLFYVGDNPKKDNFLSKYGVKTFII